MTQGLESVAFAISAVVAVVVMYDAAGVRRSVSRQSVILNRVVKELFEKRPRDEVERDLREFITRWPMRVEPGALRLGGWIFIATGLVLIILGGVFLL